MLGKRARPACAWLLGVVLAAVIVSAALRAVSFDARSIGPSAALITPVLVLFAWSHWALRPSESIRWAACAGLAAGVLVGIAAAQVAPTKWTMTDVAWHAAKIEGASHGEWLLDPILRQPTIYPFVFHALLAIPVELGASVRTTMWIATPIALALLFAAYRWFAASFCTSIAAACASIALPLAFYAPLEGFILLPNPFNFSLGVVFAGLGLLARGTTTGARTTLAGAGCTLGLAAVMWYGHLPWLGLTVVASCWRSPRRFGWIALGALAWALLLLAHFVILETRGMLGATAFNPATIRETLMERFSGLARNMVTLAGGTKLGASAACGGGLILLAAIVASRRGLEPSPRPRAILYAAIVGLGASLVWATARATFWQPLVWRYAFLFYACMLALLAGAKPWPSARRALGPIHVLALLAIGWGTWCLLPRVNESRRLAAQFEESASSVCAYLEAHTNRGEPVFASFDTWDLVIGVGSPRPNLVARNGGVHNFAPADVVKPRWADYGRMAESDDARAVGEILRPYGFKLAVVSQRDRERPGFRALTGGYTIAFENAAYVVVDLERPL